MDEAEVQAFLLWGALLADDKDEATDEATDETIAWLVEVVTALESRLARLEAEWVEHTMEPQEAAGGARDG